jgi:hypothetical protein
LDLNSSHPISEDDTCGLSPDLPLSEYHTVCEDNSLMSNDKSKQIFATDSKDDTCPISPDLPLSEYHTICEDIPSLTSNGKSKCACPNSDDSRDETCGMSPLSQLSEYHTICEDASLTSNSKSRRPDGSSDTGTLHTAEDSETLHISEDAMTECDINIETVSSHTEIDEDDLSEDITPTFDSDITSSKNDNDASTIIDVVCQDENVSCLKNDE